MPPMNAAKNSLEILAESEYPTLPSISQYSLRCQQSKQENKEGRYYLFVFLTAGFGNSSQTEVFVFKYMFINFAEKNLCCTEILQKIQLQVLILELTQIIIVYWFTCNDFLIIRIFVKFYCKKITEVKM